MTVDPNDLENAACFCVAKLPRIRELMGASPDAQKLQRTFLENALAMLQLAQSGLLRFGLLCAEQQLHHFAVEAFRGAIDVLHGQRDAERLSTLGMYCTNRQYEAFARLCFELAAELVPESGARLLPPSAASHAPDGADVSDDADDADAVLPLCDDAPLLLSQCAGVGATPFGRAAVIPLLRYNAMVGRAQMGHLDPRAQTVTELDLSCACPSEAEVRLLAHVLRDNP